MSSPRIIGTSALGIRTPIVRQGDDLIEIILNALQSGEKQGAFRLRDGDIISVTESLLARAQGNYATVEQVARDAARRLPGDFAVLFPILSRNRFALILQGLALTRRKITVILSYPCDEVGNQLMDTDRLIDSGLDRQSVTLSKEEFRERFGGDFRHPFTGLDYIDLYESVAVNGNIRVVLSNDYRAALDYAPHVLIANVHERERLKQNLIRAGAQTVIGLDDLLIEPVDGSGYNPQYGLLGSNQAGAGLLKLFPRGCDEFVHQVQAALLELTGKHLEVMIFGDGAFKDPQGKIWELADPVVSPGFTPGLEGYPRELKIKYLADSEKDNLSTEQITANIRDQVKLKQKDKPQTGASIGTTPRRLTDLLGSLSDLVSGSGDKGTPLVLIQGYFDDFSTP